MTNREGIALVRKGLNEEGADSAYTNKFIYSKMMEHAKWLIPRDAKSGKLFSGTNIFQTARCVPVIKVTDMNNCCSITTCCELYRTRNKVINLWEDQYGPIVKNITSIDGSTSFTYISITDWQRKDGNPYNKHNNEDYVFYDEGYFYFPKKGPKKVNIQGFFSQDIVGVYGCEKIKINTCVRFLDTKFVIPAYLEAEMIEKSIESILQTSKKIHVDADINKNPNRVD